MRTGKELSGSDHPCCGNDEQYHERKTGLAAEFNVPVSNSDFRWRLPSPAGGNASAATMTWSQQPYVPPSQSLDFLKARTPSSDQPASKSATITLASETSRRESFMGMLRRMFGR